MGERIYDINFKKERYEMKDLPKVTFGIINCNRLHYLKSCVESLILCTSDYDNKEIIIVDNASVEPGTDEYLSQKASQGIIVHKTKRRDPNNEFAKALNFITSESSGDFIASIQGDMQFTLNGGWLEEYVKFYEKFKNIIGCMGLDAQRTTRIKNQSKFSEKMMTGDYSFLLDYSRIPFSCSADVMYSRESLEFMGPFLEKNDGHESGVNSEDDMRQRILQTVQKDDLKIFCALPLISPASAIFTDSRGTNARVRGNRRYGDYWEAKEDFKYYDIIEFDDAIRAYKDRAHPVGIEELAIPLGWNAPIDASGNWMKNPIRIENAASSDWEEIDPNIEVIQESKSQSYVDEWLED
jgi:glycosyltransferase involved in cell wall biosynthesis